MLLEEQRMLHEDIERLEQAIAERLMEEPRTQRERLARDHEIANFLRRIESQSKQLLNIYADRDGSFARELTSISTGEPFEEFFAQLNDIKAFHRRYPYEPVENLEKAYKRGTRVATTNDTESELETNGINFLFSGEEAFGKFLDLTALHVEYVNLTGVKGVKQCTYLQYIDLFDKFNPPECPLKSVDKAKVGYQVYLKRLCEYLERFIQNTRPLERFEEKQSAWENEFNEEWNANVKGGKCTDNGEDQEVIAPTSLPNKGGGGRGSNAVWCEVCQKGFASENLFKYHVKGKKHQRALTSEPHERDKSQYNHNKERRTGLQEFLVKKMADVLVKEREDTKSNVERKQVLTDRERQQELEALEAEMNERLDGGVGMDGRSDSEGEERIYNPLKLPLAWDGKPIPYWLYKLHGLGVEFACEICGNFVYMGRRAFDKHFNEARHIYGLRCLGITNTTLFREITKIQDALRLWEKIQKDKRRERALSDNVVQMEDAEGNVMPEKVYYDLQKQGLL